MVYYTTQIYSSSYMYMLLCDLQSVIHVEPSLERLEAHQITDERCKRTTLFVCEAVVDVRHRIILATASHTQLFKACSLFGASSSAAANGPVRIVYERRRRYNRSRYQPARALITDSGPRLVARCASRWPRPASSPGGDV
ncbi:hypothetical protein QTP88_025835 [Uroleucon formosanum]